MKLGAAEARRIRRVFAASEKAGIAVYAVGGCVRDALLGRSTRDLDLVVDGDASRLARKIRAASGGSFESFGRFGTVRFLWPDGGRVDLARARTERYLAPAALPTVRPAQFEEDLKRRDFTVNAMARQLTKNGFGPLIDPFGGAADLRGKRLRALHSRSFRDDPTRLYRGARYAGRLGLRPEPKTAAWIKSGKRFTSLLSRERIRQELWRILEERDPGPAFRRVKAWGLSDGIYPGFAYPRVSSTDPIVRLGLCAAVLGDKFVKSLPLGKEISRPILDALRVIETKRSPSGPLDSQAMKIVKGACPRQKPAAFKQAFLTGSDLVNAGFKPGPEFKKILESAAHAQWRGAIASRGAALRWLRCRA